MYCLTIKTAAVGTGDFLGGAVSGLAGGFVNGAGNSWLSGQSFGQGFFKGFESGFSSGLISGGIGGMVGGYSSISGPPRGTISETPKGTFWEGHYKTGAFTASTGDDIVNGGTLPEVTVYGKAGMGAVKGSFGFGYSLNAGFGIGSKGSQISIGYIGEHGFGQLFISVGHPNYNTRVPHYIDCSISAQIMAGGTNKGPINLSGPGRSFGAGYGMFGGGYSTDLEGNLKIYQLGTSMGMKYTGGYVKTSTKTMPWMGPRLWNAVGFKFYY